MQACESFLNCAGILRLWLSIKARRRYAIARRSRVKWGFRFGLVMHVKDVTGTDAEITGSRIVRLRQLKFYTTSVRKMVGN